MRIAFLIMFIAWLLPTLAAHAAQTAQQFKGEVNGKPAEMAYWLALPKGYDSNADKKWPVLVFLHGSGERGDNLNAVKKHGPPKLADQGKDLPFITISPQCPRGQWWDVDVVMALIDSVLKQHKADPDRVIMTGLSMGGFGTWAICSKYPDRFAAAAPICGGGDPAKVAAMKRVPTWVFHGDKDFAVPIKRSQVMVDALKAAGSDVKFTIYKGVGHNSWDKAYSDPRLYQWMLKQKRKSKS